MTKTKHNPPEKRGEPKARFIKFNKMQRAYISEVLARQQKEFSDALGTIYENLGIAEKILQAPPGTFVLRQDFSGLDVMPVAVVPKIESIVKPSEKPEPGKKEAEKEEEQKKEKTH